MTSIYPLNDLTELVEFCKPHGLYLKPLARVNVTIKLPVIKDPGKSISNWDLMERLKKQVRPHQFCTIKVIKNALEFVRFEAELENRQTLQNVIAILENCQLKIIGHFEALKVTAGEAKLLFPTKHDWDAFFRDAKNMNELKPGERPDTMYISGMPCKWFSDKRKSKDDPTVNAPSEFTFRHIFESFGLLRCVDIPMTDPYRRQTSNGLKTFNYSTDVTFDGYVQYVEYIGFVKAMDALRGMKMVHVDEDGVAHAAIIKVEFDRTKHLSDKYIRKRRLEREHIIQHEEAKALRLRLEEEERLMKEAEEKRLAEDEALRLEAEKEERRKEREDKRRLRQVEKKALLEQQRFDRKIKLEERKCLLAQRKLESMRLLAVLLQKVAIKKQKEEVERQTRELEEAQRRELEEKAILAREEEHRRLRLLKQREYMLRHKVLVNFKLKQQHGEEVDRDLVREQMAGIRLKSVANARNFSIRRGFIRGVQRGRGMKPRGTVFRGRGNYVMRGTSVAPQLRYKPTFISPAALAREGLQDPNKPSGGVNENKDDDNSNQNRNCLMDLDSGSDSDSNKYYDSPLIN